VIKRSCSEEVLHGEDGLLYFVLCTYLLELALLSVCHGVGALPSILFIIYFIFVIISFSNCFNGICCHTILIY
jgi:hypothetical protein